MNFSYEEVFSMYGQFDSFVIVDFHPGSEAYSKYKPSLMGTFLYTYEERRALQQVIEGGDTQRTNQYVKFLPSPMENELNESQKIELDKQGFLSEDIAVIGSYRKPRENRFNYAGKKELPNTITVQFNSDGTPVHLLQLGLFRTRLKSGYALVPIEMDKYHALLYYVDPGHVDPAVLGTIIDKENGQLIDAVRLHYLVAKMSHVKLNEAEDVDLKQLLSKMLKERQDVLNKELEKAGEDLVDLYKNNPQKLAAILYLTAQFDDVLLLPYKKPIWWDFERFLHIYMRHVEEFKTGDNFEDKTVFQYKLKEIEHVIESVIKSIYDEIEDHFSNNPTKPFKRIGKRAVYYDGHYYRVEIEPTGRLISFHPYNNAEQMKQDQE